MKNKFSLGAHCNIDTIEYATQGNAILGIIKSGKSYTATYIAERLLDAGIPIIAFDPIGIWRNLKVGVKGKGYDVVVVGDDADLPLQPDRIADIIRAAMRERISLVIDLFSMDLSKADWRTIVERSIHVLLYENKDHGVRHVFLEEAAEFVPQRIGPEQGRVYAEIEKLSRMGGNSRLGFTLINQRAEEVNKAVLELCECIITHRQRGRNSLTALNKWLEYADVSAKDIIQSIPHLSQGECWVWLNEHMVRTKVYQKRTYHPDRRSMHGRIPSTKQVDVSAFVKRLAAATGIVQKEKDDVDSLRQQVSALERQLKHNVDPHAKNLHNEVSTLKATVWTLVKRIGSIASNLDDLRDDISQAVTDLRVCVDTANEKAVVTDAPTQVQHVSSIQESTEVFNGVDRELSKCERAIFVFLSANPTLVFSKPQIAVMVGYSVKSSGFVNAMSYLVTRGYILRRDGKKYSVNSSAPRSIFNESELSLCRYSTRYIIQRLRSVSSMGKCAKELFNVLLDNPEKSYARDSLCALTPSKYSPESSGVINSISLLCTLSLAKRVGGLICLSDDVKAMLS